MFAFLFTLRRIPLRRVGCCDTIDHWIAFNSAICYHALMSELLEAEVVVDGVRLDTADVTAVRAAVSNMLADFSFRWMAAARRNKRISKKLLLALRRPLKIVSGRGKSADARS